MTVNHAKTGGLKKKKQRETYEYEKKFPFIIIYKCKLFCFLTYYVTFFYASQSSKQETQM